MDNDKKVLDKSFWNLRWETHNTGWDIGYPSPPIVEYMKRYSDKNVAILIPGCGNAHEAEFLANNGFTNISLVDIAPKAVEILKEKFKANPAIKIFCTDFFEFEGQFDLMIEQTFFCTHYPWRREKYVKKANSLLKSGGRIIGVLFASEFEFEGPPFGGTKSDYKKIFEPFFEIKNMEECYNSIPPRAGNELFIEFVRN